MIENLNLPLQFRCCHISRHRPRCDTINVSSVTRVLGVLFTPDLSLEQHIDAVCAKCFFQLRQLRRVWRTLDDASIAILVHAFVTSLIDYCISLLAGAPRTLTDKLQRVMNAAARIISNTRKFDHGLTNLQHNVLHWLDVSDRITFRLCVQVYQCLRGMAPSYLSELCRLESEGRRQLRSSHLAAVSSPYLATTSQPSADMRLATQVRKHGTHYRTISDAANWISKHLNDI